MNKRSMNKRKLLTAGTVLGPLGMLSTLSTFGTFGVGLPSSAFAQSGRVIKLILPVATGSGVDTITRTAQPALSKALNANVVVENQPGAGGILGTSNMIRSAPDGNTLSFVSNNHVIYPSVYKSVPFDPVADITPIAVLGSTPLILVVSPKLPANNMKELVALLKAKPDGYTYASSGNGTILHLAAEMFVDQADAKVRHVPYKGVGPMLTDLIGGHVDFGVAALPSVQQHIKSGALRAIGTGTAQRLSAAPEIPTMTEQGMPGYLVEGWFALIGPKGLPAAEIAKLRQGLIEAFNTPEVKEAMAKQGNTINISSSEAAAPFFKSELAKYARLVKNAGIELQ